MKRLTHLRLADRTLAPWKNGGGLTSVIATFPVDGAGGEWDWRISTALIDRPGAFSHFADVDRDLLLLSGTLALDIAGRSAPILLLPGEVAKFPGDEAVFGTPIGGEAIDLNVMTRRGHWDVAVDQITPPAQNEFKVGADFLLALFTGEGRLDLEDGSLVLRHHDAALIKDSRGRLVALDSQSTVILISISATDTNHKYEQFHQQIYQGGAAR